MRYYLSLFIFIMIFFTPNGYCSEYKFSIYNDNYNRSNILNSSHLEYVNPNAPKGGHIKIGVLGNFDNLNPYIFKGSPAPGIKSIHGKLLEESLNEVGVSYPYISSKIEIISSSEVIFYINPLAKFNNGESITSDDVLFSFISIKKYGHPIFKNYFSKILGAKVINKNSIKFLFKEKESSNRIIFILGQLPILSNSYYKNKEFDKITLNTGPCSGPYEVDKIIPGHTITYKRIKDWWGKGIFSQRGLHNFDYITYEVYRDNNVLFEAFKLNYFDILFETSSSRWKTAYNFQAFKKNYIKKLEFQIKSTPGTSGFFLNTRNSLFSDRDIRRALIMLFDFQWINKTLFHNQYIRNTSYFPLSPISLQSDRPPSNDEIAVLKEFKNNLPKEVLESSYNLLDNKKSKRDIISETVEILKNSGWKLNNHGVLEKKGTLFKFNILIHNKSLERILMHYVQTLKRIGIIAEIILVDSTIYENRIRELDFDIIFMRIPQSNFPGSEQENYWGSKWSDIKDTLNYSGIKNQVIDALINKLSLCTEYKNVVTITRALDRVLLWGFYIIPSWHRNRYWIAVWDKFHWPKNFPSYYPGAYIDSWWMDKKNR